MCVYLPGWNYSNLITNNSQTELENKNKEISELASEDRKVMTDLSYEFEEIQKRHDKLLSEWEVALIELEEQESQLKD